MRTSNAKVVDQRTLDRRASARQLVCVPCTVYRDGTMHGIYWTEDLAARGALLDHGRTFAPGSTLSLTLHFPWDDPLHVQGTVVRQQQKGNGDSTFAVAFTHDTTMSEALTGFRIERALEIRKEAKRPRHRLASVVITEQSFLANALRRDIAELGTGVMVATRPLDVLWYLSDPEQMVGSVFVDHAISKGAVIKWLRFLEEGFPEVSRILVAEGSLPAAVSTLLASRQIHAVLAVPWQTRYLEDLVRVETPRGLVDGPLQQGASLEVS